MPKRHTIDKLPSELREQIRAYLKEPRGVGEFTDAVNALLEEEGLDERVSKSSAHRYMQTYAKLGERLRQSQELAETFAADLGGLAEDKRIRYLASLVQELAFEFIGDHFKRGEDDESLVQTPKNLAALGRLARDLAGTLKDTANLEILLRDRRAREAAAKLDAAVEDAVASGEKGLSAERVAQLRRDFLGVRKTDLPA